MASGHLSVGQREYGWACCGCHPEESPSERVVFDQREESQSRLIGLLDQNWLVAGIASVFCEKPLAGTQNRIVVQRHHRIGTESASAD